jgi:hypothetical protein
MRFQPAKDHASDRRLVRSRRSGARAPRGLPRAPAGSSPFSPPAGAGDSSGLAFARHAREENTRAGNPTDEGPGHEPY